VGTLAKVLIPVPDLDSDPTEVAVSWKVLVGAGHTVRFATLSGSPAHGDDLMVTGRGLDPWGFVPGLSRVVGIGRVLRADARGWTAYRELIREPGFREPLHWDEVSPDRFDALLLPGGHRAPPARWPWCPGDTHTFARRFASHL
jgi:putative intracellular protease/amidase